MKTALRPFPLLIIAALAVGPLACRKADTDPSKRDAEAKAQSADQARKQAEQERQRAEERLRERQQSDLLARRAQDYLKDVYFDYDQAELPEPSRAMLRQVAAFLKDHAQITLRIEGHADERGTNEYNLALGERRAASVATYLTTLGVMPARLTTISYGRERPLCTTHAENCWHLNRRAHFEVTADPGEGRVAALDGDQR